MNKIKAAIIEDEIPAGRLLHKMLSGLRPDWEIVVLPGSVEGSVKWFQEHPHPDIIFLDIQLTDGISFTFIEQTQPESMIILPPPTTNMPYVLYCKQHRLSAEANKQGKIDRSHRKV